VRYVAKLLIIAGLLALSQNAAWAQIPVPVPGATPSPPPSALPVDPNSNIDSAKPPLSPSQLVGKSLRDVSEGEIGKAAKDDVEALRRGPLLIHGNYCGIGNRPGTEPTDALDVACMRHDACTPTGGLPSCACDQRFRAEATAVAEDPTTPADLKVTAVAAAAAIAVLVCPTPGSQ
jgi:hypothetical protein